MVLPSKRFVNSRAVEYAAANTQEFATAGTQRMLYTEQHRELMRSVTKFVETEIDPHAQEWDEAGIFPAHELFKKMGQQGFLGIHKPEREKE